MNLDEKAIIDYFFDRCTPAEARCVRQGLADCDASLLDGALLRILDQLEQAPEGDGEQQAQRAYRTFCRRVEALRRRQRLHALRRWAVGIAASLALPLTIALAWALGGGADGEPVNWLDVTTAPGQHASITLADGTTIDVNAGSRLIYPDRFAGDERRVFLYGEMFADVAKDAGRPFVVSIGDMRVNVLGTRLNIRAYAGPDNVEVTLVEGAANFAVANVGSAILHPGELVQFDRASGEFKRDTFNPEAYICPSRQTGFYFNDLPLGDIVRQLERCFNVSILVADRSLLHRTYTAYFSNGEEVDEILAKLNNSGQMAITRSGREIAIAAASDIQRKQ